MNQEEKISRRDVIRASDIARSAAMASEEHARQALLELASQRRHVRELAGTVEILNGRLRVLEAVGQSLWTRLRWLTTGRIL